MTTFKSLSDLCRDMPYRRLAVWAPVLTIAVLVLWQRNRVALPDFPERATADGAPQCVLEFNRRANGGLAGYPGRDFDYHLGEPVLVTTFLKLAAGTEVKQVRVTGQLKEVSRQESTQFAYDHSRVLVVDLKLRCLEVAPVWQSKIEVEWQPKGSDARVLSVPVEVMTSRTTGRQRGHPSYAPLVKGAAYPWMLMSLGILAGGLFLMFIGVHFILPKRIKKQREPVLTREERFRLLDDDLLQYAALFERQATATPDQALRAAALLRERFEEAACLTSEDLALIEGELGTNGALSRVLFYLDRCVCRRHRLTAAQTKQVVESIKEILGAGAPKPFKVKLWVVALVVLALPLLVLWLAVRIVYRGGALVIRKIRRRRAA